MTSKRVKIMTTNPIPLKVVLRGNIEDITLSLDDIKTCITAKAQVDEILTDGTLVRLNYKNYNIDNNKARKEQLEKEREERRKKEIEERNRIEQQQRMKEQQERNKQHNQNNNHLKENKEEEKK